MAVYCVVPVNWEYNDEYHTEEGYEEPVKVFSDYGKAREEANRLTLIKLRKHCIYDYGGYPGDNNQDKFIERIAREGYIPEIDPAFPDVFELDDYFYWVPSKAIPDDVLLAALDDTDIDFYRVIETEIA